MALRKEFLLPGSRMAFSCILVGHRVVCLTLLSSGWLRKGTFGKFGGQLVDPVERLASASWQGHDWNHPAEHTQSALATGLCIGTAGSETTRQILQ